MREVYLLCGLFMVLGLTRGNGQGGFDRNYRPLRSGSFVQDKNFYLLTVLEQWTPARQALDRSLALQEILRAKKQQLQQAASSCGLNTHCHTDALRLTNAETTLANRALGDLYQREEAVRQVVTKHLRPSGMYQRYADSTDVGLLRNAWQDAARGLNRIIDVYALGQKPRYADIDSVSYDVKHGTYPRLIDITVNTLNSEGAQYSQFFEPTLQFALALLDLNDRDEAGRFEPLREKANQAVVQNVPQIKWDSYPYSVILVQGAGPDLPGSPLDAWAKLRMRLAVDRYRRGLAPILVVSGGNVHPMQTPFNESMEMKKALMSRYGIPEYAILVESHSRHSTTNLRNTARLLFQYGIPTDKPMVVTADMYQSKYMEGEVFTKRCQQELGYLPHKIVKRLSPFDLVLLPQLSSLYADSIDPLDP